MKSIASFVFLALISSVVSQGVDYYLQGCKGSTDQEVNQCIRMVFDRMRPSIHEAIPSLNVPQLEPINLGNFNFVQTEGGVNIDAKFSEVVVSGFSKYVLESVESNLQTGKIVIKVSIPEFRVKGKYNLSGNILLLPITGTGPFGAHILDIKATLTGNIVRVNENGKERLSVPNTHVDFQVAKFRVKLLNLFNGDKVLGDTVNHFINTNDQLILNEIKPGVTNLLSSFVGSILDAAYSVIPVTSQFPTSG